MKYSNIVKYISIIAVANVLAACAGTGLMGSKDDFACKDYDQKEIKCNSLSENYEKSLLTNLPSYKITYTEEKALYPSALIVRPLSPEEAKSAESKSVAPAKAVAANKVDIIESNPVVTNPTVLANDSASTQATTVDKASFIGVPAPVSTAKPQGLSNTGAGSGVAATTSVKNNAPTQLGSSKGSQTPSAAQRKENPYQTVQRTRVAPTVVRVWLAPWEDSDKDLNDESFVYITLDSGRWNIDAYKSKIDDRQMVRYNLESATNSSTIAPENKKSRIDIGSTFGANDNTTDKQ